MKGKELAKLLQCIIDEQGVKWGTEMLYDKESGKYCAIGLLAKGAGVPDRLLDGSGWPEWVREDGPMGHLPSMNDGSQGFLDFTKRLSEGGINYPVKSFLRKLKKWKEWEKKLNGD